ncbi:hypothetical protein ANAEL_05046 [Anaerolineales bacterium]|nr:hypothetical protein ANAEL_05046 [Anaerolineales bacterium]
MKIKFSKPLFFSVIMIVVALACGVGNDLSTPQPVSPPVGTWTLPPSVIPRQPRTPTPFFMPVLSTPKAVATYPVWVADFSDPILEAVEGQLPVFEDHFPEICVDEHRKWKVCSTPEQRTYYQSPLSELPLATARPTLDLQPDLQDGYALLNKGWFYVIPDNSRNPFYALIDSGTLVLKLPAEKESKDFWVYTPHLLQKNFVLQFDLEFYENQPEDTFRLQVDQTSEQSVAFDLSKDQNWALHWGSLADWQTITGIYANFPPEPITVLVMAKGEECAVYIDNVPLAYLPDCRSEPVTRPSPSAMKFHLLAEPGHLAVVTIDNVKMWDLDKIPDLP